MKTNFSRNHSARAPMGEYAREEVHELPGKCLVGVKPDEGAWAGRKMKMTRPGQSVWLRGGVGELFIYLGTPPRGTKGKRVEPMTFASELRAWIATGVGANHAVWIKIYEWLGRPLPKPPRREDLTRMAEQLVEAFERGRLVAVEGTFGRTAARDARAPNTARAPTMPRDPLLVATDTTWFSITVLDEVGDPLDGLNVAYSVLGERRVLTTDDRGVARLDGISSGFASAALQDLDAVRAKLKPRWQKARAPKRFEEPNVVVREIGDRVVEPMSLECEVPAVLVITPYFHCHEIPGAHFAFGRSFPLAAALDSLAGIAEELSNNEARKGMIFGHTDRAGSEALNKELSERRAKALYSLFTHDAESWEELFSGTADGPHWKEKWGVLEAQHMLNTLGVTDDGGHALAENGQRDAATKQAIKRFRGGDYPDCPAEQNLLSPSDHLGLDGRKELFLAYAKRVTRKPVDRARFTVVGGKGFMGCGEYNPLSFTAHDAESRRAVVFVFDPAAEPQNLPCKMRALGPCKASSSPPLDKASKPDESPYRCKIYREIARQCPCNGGADLSHDLILVFPITLREANTLPHAFVLESEDGTIKKEQLLKSDARANDRNRAELYFNHLPETHSYRLQCTEEAGPHTLLDYDTLPVLQEKAQAQAATVLEPYTAALHDLWLAAKDDPPMLEGEPGEPA